MSAPRKWALWHGDPNRNSRSVQGIQVGIGDHLRTDGSPVDVIELEPVLTLLEGVMMPTEDALRRGEGLTVEEREAAALLKAHGRLKGSAA